MITNLIDEIEQTKCDAMFDVFNSLIVEYNKHVEFDNVTEIFQEGEILNNVKERGKNDSTFWKIIKFIPRLLSELWNKLKKKFKKETPEEKKKREEAENKLRKDAEKSSKPGKLELFGNKVIDVIKKIDIKKTAIGGCVAVGVTASGVVIYKYAYPSIKNAIKMHKYTKSGGDRHAVLFRNPDGSFKINHNMNVLSPKQSKELLKKTKEFQKKISNIKDSDPAANEKRAKILSEYNEYQKNLLNSDENTKYFENKWFKSYDEYQSEGAESSKNIAESIDIINSSVTKIFSDDTTNDTSKSDSNINIANDIAEMANVFEDVANSTNDLYSLNEGDEASINALEKKINADIDNKALDSKKENFLNDHNAFIENIANDGIIGVHNKSKYSIDESSYNDLIKIDNNENAEKNEVIKQFANLLSVPTVFRKQDIEAHVKEMCGTLDEINPNLNNSFEIVKKLAGNKSGNTKPTGSNDSKQTNSNDAKPVTTGSLFNKLNNSPKNNIESLQNLFEKCDLKIDNKEFSDFLSKHPEKTEKPTSSQLENLKNEFYGNKIDELINSGLNSDKLDDVQKIYDNLNNCYDSTIRPIIDNDFDISMMDLENHLNDLKNSQKS